MNKHEHKRAPRAPGVFAPEALPRTIAFYLPQFHPIPENDAWWGKGFTEWTNVTRAEPLFDGHHQPRRPADLGYYDLRIPEIMEQQAALARQYGIHGFCYYYYWFAGHRLLEKPLDRMLESGSPDFPFCLCWANENWSRRWDGSEQEVLMKQEYGPDYARRIIRDMLPFLLDSRYITVDGKPLLLVYRVDIIPDCADMTAIWREEAAAAGLPGLYLVRVESFVELDPRPYGFDAACEFPPHLLHKVALSERASVTNQHPEFSGALFDYDKVAQYYISKPAQAYRRFKAVVPAWDNTARKKLKAYVLNGSTPALYKAWLTQCLRETATRFKNDERLLFINAWNEWAEGCYLEPDQTFGHQYLEATRDAQLTVQEELLAAGVAAKKMQRAQGMDFAIALFDNKQFEEAYAAFLVIIERDKSNPLALVYLGLIALASALPDEAHNFFGHAIGISSDRANTMAAIGQRCMESGELAFAEHYFSAAIQTQPKLQGAFALLADVWELQGRRTDALQLLASLVEGDRNPQKAILARYVTLARELGDPEHERLACLRAAAFPDSHARAIALLNYADDSTPEQIHDEARRFATNHNRPDTRQLPAGPRQRLRVGFALGKLDTSSLSARLEPLLRQLDPQRFETVILAMDSMAGEPAQRLFLLADDWRTLQGLDEGAIDQQIREMDIDVLINLDGHANLAALRPFSRRHAPLQINWRVPASPLALPCVDYALLDASAHSDEALLTTFSEKLAVIEHQNAWAFPTLPARLPAANAPFTFGSMTPVNLVSLNTWNTWAEILREAPATRLQLNASEAGNEARQRVFRLLADKGVDASRISWVSATEAGDICAAWQDINLGLCPLAGDSGYDMLLGAWSGVPSLALGSGTPWTRVASGLLALLDQRSFIAPDTAAYVSLAIAQSRDRNALQAQGMALRARLQESAIVDTAGFASAFGMTLEHLWREAGGSLGSEA